jgi:hypothetical protein
MPDYDDGAGDFVDEAAAMTEAEFAALQEEYQAYGTWTPEGGE